MFIRAVCAVALIATPAFSAEFLGSHTWRPDWHGAGGYSALWLSPDGARFVTLSDKGGWVEGALTRDTSGAVDDVTVTRRGDLLRSTGDDLKRGETDAEGIARVGAQWFVSFEGAHRVMRHDSLDTPPERMPLPDAFDGLQTNSGLEALASDAEGNLYAIPERSGLETRPFPVFRFNGETWDQPFSLRRDGRYLVAGADVGPDGRLYLLERDFAVIGFRTRVRSFDLTGGDERLELESGLRAHDNLEGISVWRDAEGRLRVTMLSDDNLKSIQKTEFVDYVLD